MNGKILLFFVLALLIAHAAQLFAALLAVILIFAQVFDGDVRHLFGEGDVRVPFQPHGYGRDLDLFDALFPHEAVEFRIGEHKVQNDDAALDHGAHDLVRPALERDGMGGFDLFAILMAEYVGDDLVIAVARRGL